MAYQSEIHDGMSLSKKNLYFSFSRCAFTLTSQHQLPYSDLFHFLVWVWYKVRASKRVSSQLSKFNPSQDDQSYASSNVYAGPTSVFFQSNGRPASSRPQQGYGLSPKFAGNPKNRPAQPKTITLNGNLQPPPSSGSGRPKLTTSTGYSGTHKKFISFCSLSQFEISLHVCVTFLKLCKLLQFCVFCKNLKVLSIFF